MIEISQFQEMYRLDEEEETEKKPGNIDSDSENPDIAHHPMSYLPPPNKLSLPKSEIVHNKEYSIQTKIQLLIEKYVQFFLLFCFLP